MDPELKRMLDETHALVKDNHRMLRALRRYQLVGFFGKIIIWALVLILPLYLYQQYLGPLVAKFSAFSETSVPSSMLFDLPTATELQKLINSYKAGN